MAVVISGANFNQEEANKAASINYKNNTGVAGKTAQTGDVKTFASAIVSKGDGSAQANDATYKSLLQEADDVKSQIMASATNAKDNLKALFNKLSGAEAVQIDEDGFNLTTASPEDCVNIVEKIKIELAIHSDNYVPSGTPIDADKIAQVTGSAGMANTVASKMSQAGIVPTGDNQEEVSQALDTASKITPMSESVKNYMVSNQIAPSIDGIYQAEHAVNAVENLETLQNQGEVSNDNNINGINEFPNESFEAMRGQIEQVIQSAGLEVNDQNLNNAKNFLNQDIPVTKENLAYKAHLDSIDLSKMNSDEKKDDVFNRIMANMVIGESAGSTLLSEEEPIIKQVADVIDILNKSDITTIENIYSNPSLDVVIENTQADKNMQENVQGSILEKGTFTVQDLKEAQLGIQKVESNQSAQNSQNLESNQNAVQSGYAILQEARILMTADAGVFLAKQGMNLYTMSVYEMTQQLQEYKQAQLACDDGDFQQVFDVEQAMLEVSQAPIDVIGQVLSGKITDMGVEERLSLATFAKSGSNLKQQYDRAGRDYEAVGTQVRKDLGDKITKAIDNSTDSILKGLNLENNERNRAAVRILASNQMEMTEENINQVKAVHETLNHLIENMKPETVLSMIRDQVNPLTDDINDVNSYLMQQNESASEDNSEKYSKFLYKLDQTNGITQQERSQFIGIYKMMNIFTKDAGESIGALVKQGSEITMGNLMTAYESRKSYGMDVNLDTDAGMSEVNGTVQFYQSLFANTGEQVTPHTLLAAQEQKEIAQYGVEEFCDTVEKYYDPEIEAESLTGYIEEMKRSIEANQAVFRQIEIAGETVNVNNIQAVKQMLETGMFPKVKGKNVADGIEKIGHKEDLEEMYETLSAQSDEELTEMLQVGNSAKEKTQTYEELLAARLNHQEIGFIKKLAIRHDYQIPLETQDGTGMIHLTLVQDEENQGRISVEMNQEEIGKISLEAKISNDRTDLFVMQDKSTQTSENTENLSARMDQMQMLFDQVFDMKQVNVYQSSTDRMPERFYSDAAEKTPTEQLYGMAQMMVKVLAGREM